MALKDAPARRGSCPLPPRARRGSRGFPPRPPRWRELSGEFRVGEPPAQAAQLLAELLGAPFPAAPFPSATSIRSAMGRPKVPPPRRRSPHPWASRPRASPPDSRARRSIIAALAVKGRLPRARPAPPANSCTLSPAGHMHLLPDRADFFDQPDDPAHLARGLRVDQCVARNSASRHAPASSRGPRSRPKALR